RRAGAVGRHRRRPGGGTLDGVRRGAYRRTGRRARGLAAHRRDRVETDGARKGGVRPVYLWSVGGRPPPRPAAGLGSEYRRREALGAYDGPGDGLRRRRIGDLQWPVDRAGGLAGRRTVGSVTGGGPGRRRCGGAEVGLAAMSAPAPFSYTPLLPLGPDRTEYRLITDEGIDVVKGPGGRN